MTAPKLQIFDLAQERAITLLSKTSGVPEEVISELHSEKPEITEDVAAQLREISKALDVDVLELFQPVPGEETIPETTVEDWLKRRSLSFEDVLLLEKKPHLVPTASAVIDVVCKRNPDFWFCHQ